jgi:hypothetical protein
LSYAFILKTKRKLRINIAGIYKIMINSPEVHLDITRSHAEVEHKNLFIFSSLKNGASQSAQRRIRVILSLSLFPCSGVMV